MNEETKQAFDIWQADLALNTRKCYEVAWKLLLEYVKKEPFQVTRKDVRLWVLLLKSQGKADNTVHHYLCAISSFYEFCFQELDMQVLNPARGKRLRPHIDTYGKAFALSVDEIKRLFAVIDKTRLEGIRDYALYLTYLLTARRNSEIRRLRFSDISFSDGKIWYNWYGKRRKDMHYEMPKDAWDAIVEYLKAWNRYDNYKPEEYIFTSLRSRGKNMLTSRFIGKALKVYAAKAGLNPLTHIHTLRHSAAMLRLQAGENVTDIRDDLGHASLEITGIYIRKLEGHKDTSSAKLMDLLK